MEKPSPDDLDDLADIVNPTFSNMMAELGFKRLKGLYYRRQPHLPIYHDVFLGVPVPNVDAFYFTFRVTSPGSPLIQLTHGFPLQYPLFIITDHSLWNWAEPQERFHMVRIPPYSFKNPFPYLNWFMRDLGPIWETWLESISTPEAILSLLINGMNNYETGPGRDRSASSLSRAACYAAELGDHDLARKLLKDPLLAKSDSKLNARLKKELANRKTKINPIEWGPI